MSSLLSLIIGTVVGLTQFRIKRLLAYSTIVRRWADIIHGIINSIQWSQLYPTTELGEGESPTLNLAFPLKWLIRLIQLSRIVIRVESSMIKATLLEVYLQRPSTVGEYLDWYRIFELNEVIWLCTSLWSNLTLGITNTSEPEKGQSKDDYRISNRTTGLPKVSKGYGNRGIIVPSRLNLKWNKGSNDPVILGRILGRWYCKLTKVAGDTSTVKSDDLRKLQWLEEKCRNKEFVAMDIYKLMFKPKLFELACQKLKSKPGNMTPGIVPTTLDGFSIEIINEIIGKLKDESFKFSPGRRVMIPKASGGERPLTVAPPRDKIVQEVMRMILESVFEPNFSPNSHGFRPNRGCHTALKQVFTQFGVASWYIEGDISKCFDSFDHKVLLRILRTRVKDERFINLIIKALNAGYFEFGEYKHSMIGTPQGSIISPLLCNIYLNEFDKFIDTIGTEFSVGTKAKGNPLWISYSNKKRRAKTLKDKLLWHKLLLKTPSKDPMDPNFKKLIYVRYADDWILGVRGSYEDCNNILRRAKEFLLDELHLELSENKTLITNANKDKALFLGTEIFRTRHQNLTRIKGITKRVGKEVRLEIPIERVLKKLKEAKFHVNGIPKPRFLWLHNSKDQIIALYNSVYRGIINYYSFAFNLGDTSGYIHMILRASCAKLLAAKFSMSSQKKVYEKFGKDLKGNDNIAFAKAVYKINPWDFKTGGKKNDTIANGNLNTLYAESISIASLEGLVCSICESDYRVEMHHVRMLKDLNPKMNKVDSLMARRRRKQIPLCRKCHMEHHANKNSKNSITFYSPS